MFYNIPTMFCNIQTLEQTHSYFVFLSKYLKFSKINEHLLNTFDFYLQSIWNRDSGYHFQRESNNSILVQALGSVWTLDYLISVWDHNPSWFGVCFLDHLIKYPNEFIPISWPSSLPWFFIIFKGYFPLVHRTNFWRDTGMYIFPQGNYLAR